MTASAAAAINTRAFGPMEGKITPASVSAMIEKRSNIIVSKQLI